MEERKSRKAKKDKLEIIHDLCVIITNKNTNIHANKTHNKKTLVKNNFCNVKVVT